MKSIEHSQSLVVIAKSAIKLSEKRALYADAFRVLRPGGRLDITDVVALRTMPEPEANELDAYSSCVANAAHIHGLRSLLCELGFVDVRVEIEARSTVVAEWGEGFEQYVVSARVTATKPELVVAAA
jgi:hypothetical protein